MKKLLSIFMFILLLHSAQAQCTVSLNPATVRVTQDSTIATNLGANQYYLVCAGVTLTYNGTQSADVTYYLEDAASVVSLTSHEAILYMKRLSSIDANYSQSGQWAITSNVWHDPTATFEDYIQGANFNQCAEVIFNYGSVGNCNATTSLDTEDASDHIQMFPNPAKTSVTIESQSNEEKTIVIYNVLGKQVRQLISYKMITTIGLENLNPGTYFVSVIHGQQKTTKKLIIQR